jgi:hypothetical protein
MRRQILSAYSPAFHQASASLSAHEGQGDVLPDPAVQGRAGFGGRVLALFGQYKGKGRLPDTREIGDGRYHRKDSDEIISRFGGTGLGSTVRAKA